jgi:autotransporter-associated beta strand protein
LVEASTGKLNIDKRDGGKLTITGNQTFTGNVVLRGGQLEVQNSGSLGVGGITTGTGTEPWTAILFDPGTALVLNGANSNIVSDEHIFLRGKSSIDASIVSTAGNNKLTGRIQNEVHADGQDEIAFRVDDGGSLELSGTIAQTLTQTTTLHLVGAGAGTVSGTIVQESTGAWNIAKSESGTWTLSNTQNYTGTTTVNAGTLALGANNVVPDASSLVLAGGKLATNGHSDTFDTLAVIGNSILDLGDGSSILHFNQSDAVSWSGLLTIENWSGLTSGGGTDQIFVGSSSSGLTPSQLSAITFAGFGAGASILSTGEIVPASVGLPGDFDGDGDVDGADFVVWQTNFPTTSGATAGDADGDDDVDGADFAVWQDSFPGSGGGASPVPEPGACLLAVMALAGLTALRSRRIAHN